MQACCVVTVLCKGIIVAGCCYVASWPLHVVVPSTAFSFRHSVAWGVLGKVELNWIDVVAVGTVGQLIERGATRGVAWKPLHVMLWCLAWHFCLVVWWHGQPWGQSNQCGSGGDTGDSELRGRQWGELLKNWLLTEKDSILGVEGHIDRYDDIPQLHSIPQNPSSTLIHFVSLVYMLHFEVWTVHFF